VGRSGRGKKALELVMYEGEKRLSPVRALKARLLSGGLPESRRRSEPMEGIR